MNLRKWQLITVSFVLASLCTLVVRILLGQSAASFCIGVLPGVAFGVTEKLVKQKRLVII